MIRLFLTCCFAIALGLAGYAPASASSVEVKGPHICCPACVNSVNQLLKKVDGVSDVKVDAKAKTVAFTAKDSASAKAGFKALVDGGFFGTASEDGKEIKLDVATPKAGDKADAVVVQDVHVCCGACQKAVRGLFANSKVTFEGTGAQRNVRIEGTGLDRAEVLQALRKAGFNGNLAK